MRLRLSVSVIDLADRFQISKTTAADTFLEILNIFFIKLTPLVIWPERPELRFRSKFGCKITGIELLIDRPSNEVHEHLHGQLTKATVLQDLSLVLLLKEQFVSFQRDGEAGRVSSFLLKIQIS